MKNPIHIFPSCIVSLALLTGCQASVDLDPATDTSTASVDSDRGSSGQPARKARAQVSVQEAEQFAQSLTQAVSSNDEAAFHRLIDWQTMANKATNNLGLSSNVQKKLASGLVQGATEPGRFLNALHAGGDSKYDYLRTRTDDGKTHVFFRLVSQDGINFHDFTLDKVHGQVRAVELLVFLTGEPMSETWKRLMLPVAKEQNKNWLQKLSTSESEFVKHIDKFMLMTQQVQQGNATGALRTYESMPDSLKNEKVILLTRYQAASQVGEKEVIVAADDFRAAHPEAKCIELLMVDVHLYRKEYDKAIACLDSIQSSVGPDSYLEFLAGGLLIEKGDTQAGIERIRKATTIEPVVEDSFWALAAFASGQGDNVTIANVFKMLDERFSVNWNDYRDAPEFADFFASPEGIEWLEERGL